MIISGDVEDTPRALQHMRKPVVNVHFFWSALQSTIGFKTFVLENIEEKASIWRIQDRIKQSMIIAKVYWCRLYHK